MKLLLYCTKAKPMLRDYRGKAIYDRFVISPNDRPFTSDDKQPILNGKIVAECDFEVVFEDTSYSCIDFRLASSLDGISRLDKSCLTTEQLFDYVKGKNEFYSIYIKNLHIFDKPRELEWNYHISYYSREFQMQREKFLSKAPQNMCKVFNDDGDYILISIRPEWLCKILNGEKTIEVRKKVLKEMIQNE